MNKHFSLPFGHFPVKNKIWRVKKVRCFWQSLRMKCRHEMLNTSFFQHSTKHFYNYYPMVSFHATLSEGTGDYKCLQLLLMVSCCNWNARRLPLCVICCQFQSETTIFFHSLFKNSPIFFAESTGAIVMGSRLNVLPILLNL